MATAFQADAFQNNAFQIDVAPTDTGPGNPGGRIVGGTFSRGRWHDMQDARRAHRAAHAAVEHAKKKKRRAIEAAAEAAKEAIDAADIAEQRAVSDQLRKLTVALDAATGARTVAIAIEQSNIAIEQAIAIIAYLREIEDEEEAITVLLLS